ncbi:MAG: mandelate racemase/muconate lactonizing enzyme family protein [Synergistaceae bacterium]|jgi:galactonate dehydratase|nr:mandelate racemase/muconate lactonizing enzyme family protein [Synergistaceae bacterium]
MKITKVTPYLFHPGTGKNLLFTRVETDKGFYGWGEGYVSQGKEHVVVSYVSGMEPYLVGRSPFNIRHTGRAMFNDYVIRRSGCDFFSAWSSIEIALWDIVGKATGQPVYNLIGGLSRERVRVYANGWYDVNFGGDDTPNGMAERALRVKGMGFTAMKWDPFGRTPWRNAVTRVQEDQAVECVRKVREAVGQDVDLLIEVHRRLSPYYAWRFADRIAEFSPFWFEEPCLADNIDLVAETKQRVKMPVVTGETKYTKEDFKGIFEKRAAEIINPDICLCGGILGTMEIAAMAEPYAVMFSPHNYNSTIFGLAATVHASVSASNFLIAEYFVNLAPACEEITINPLKLNGGFIELPTGPGLGIDVDMEKLKAHPYKEFKKEFPIKGVAQYHEEQPR